MEIYASSRNFSKYGIDQEEWELENKDYITNIQPPSGSFEFTLYTISLSSSNPETAPWLKKNTFFIEYNLSMINIEVDHIINALDVIKSIDSKISDGDARTLTIQEFQTLGGAFNIDSYISYMSLTLVSKDLTINTVANYNQIQKCYSYPFFKSILFNNEFNINECLFTFVNISINSNSTIAFKVNFGNGSVKYYDYSGSPM